MDLFWVLVLFFLEGDTGSEDPVFEGTSPDEVQPCTGGEGGSEGFGVIEDRFGVEDTGEDIEGNGDDTGDEEDGES